VNSHSDTPVNTEKGVASAPMAQRLRSAFRKCIEMDGTLGKRLSAYACREPIDFSRLGEAVDRLVERIEENGGGRSPAPGQRMPPFVLPDESGRLLHLEAWLRMAQRPSCSIAGIGVHTVE
jgi:hypothetical protein